MTRRRRLRFQDRLLLLIVTAAAPGWIGATLLLWTWDANPALRWLLFALITVFAAGAALAARRRIVRPLRSLANALQALREGDYSLRGRDVDPEDAIGEVIAEVNLLGRTLHDQRLQALEASVLLEKVIAEVDIAVFAFDAQRRLRLANRAGEALLGASSADLLGRDAAQLGLTQMLDERSGRILSHTFPGGAGRWELRRRSFRQDGRPHELLVISELSRALREEERQTWRRLVRVIGHELNSSLTPIKSTAATLRALIASQKLPTDWRDDAQAGLTIIHDRAEALARFMGAYARLARLPPPVRGLVGFPALVNRVVSLHGKRVTVDGGPEVHVRIDADQIEQVLINVVKNAVEASGEGGDVCVRWRIVGDRLVAEVADEGPGLARTENLWVPFFTTKRGGTGIGLVLSREIVENHGGAISLENRTDGRGCIARISLPLDTARAGSARE